MEKISDCREAWSYFKVTLTNNSQCSKYQPWSLRAVKMLKEQEVILQLWLTARFPLCILFNTVSVSVWFQCGSIYLSELVSRLGSICCQLLVLCVWWEINRYVFKTWQDFSFICEAVLMLDRWRFCNWKLRGNQLGVKTWSQCCQICLRRLMKLPASICESAGGSFTTGSSQHDWQITDLGKMSVFFF